MTLAFIGEHYDLPAIQKAVGEVEFEPFDLSLGNLGTFPTKAGVIWCGVKDGTAATSLANQLRERLTANGVLFSTLAFVPHISLVQHPSVIVTYITIPDATIRVEKLFRVSSLLFHFFIKNLENLEELGVANEEKAIRSNSLYSERSSSF